MDHLCKNDHDNCACSCSAVKDDHNKAKTGASLPKESPTLMAAAPLTDEWPALGVLVIRQFSVRQQTQHDQLYGPEWQQDCPSCLQYHKASEFKLGGMLIFTLSMAAVAESSEPAPTKCQW